MSLLEFLWLALRGQDPEPEQRPIAQMTIISTEPVKPSNGSRSAPARD